MTDIIRTGNICNSTKSLVTLAMVSMHALRQNWTQVTLLSVSFSLILLQGNPLRNT